MKIQVVMCTVPSTKILGEKVVFSPINGIVSLDNFDVNFINLNDSTFWRSKGNKPKNDNIIEQMILLQVSIQESKSPLIIALPQNQEFLYSYAHDGYRGQGYYHSTKELRELTDLITEITALLFRQDSKLIKGMRLVSEKNMVQLKGVDYSSDFYLTTHWGHDELDLLLRSTTRKGLCAKTGDDVFLTTIDPLQDERHMEAFLQSLGLWKTVKADLPEWLKEYPIFDDAALKNTISTKQKEINDALKEIQIFEERRETYLRLKSVLVENGENLVILAKEMLQNIMKCDLSMFVDEKKEDFNIKWSSVTFVGEIKGVTSNVQNSYISQLTTHCECYKEKLSETGEAENVKGLLIINHQRGIPFENREPVHGTQIEKAKRDKVLIVETVELLKIYEAVVQGEITSEKIISRFLSEIGLFKL